MRIGRYAPVQLMIFTFICVYMPYVVKHAQSEETIKAPVTRLTFAGPKVGQFCVLSDEHCAPHSYHLRLKSFIIYVRMSTFDPIK